MTRQSLYRRYRPQRFADVRGQDDLVDVLRRAVAEDRVGQAYLFSGPRGTGKTTTARILAKALNCTDPSEGEPCGSCPSCVAIAEGSSFDVFELDAASHNGVDAMRDLIERASQGTPGRRKVYILDEAHMLSKGASNALLKTLEEPPDHVVFVLATTDPLKLLPTIRSRTQHFEVHLLDTADLAALVDEVVEAAGLDVDAEARQWAVRSGAGSARDTLSALERAAALGGIPDAVTNVEALVDALASSDTAAALQLVDQAVRAGRSPQDIGNEIVERLRHVFLATMGVPPGDLPADDAATIATQATALGARGATHALEVLGEALVGITGAPDPRVPLELAVVRITRPETDSSASALLGRIERLERALAAGAVGPPPEAPAPSAVPPVAAPPAPAPPTPAPTSAPPEAVPPGATIPASAPSGAPDGDAPAAAARQALASHRRGEQTSPQRPPPVARPVVTPEAPVASAPSPDPTPKPAPAAKPQATPEAEPETAAGASTTVADNADAMVAPDVVARAWHGLVTESSDQKVRARFGTGRLVDSTAGVMVVALPNDRVLQRCLPLVPDLQRQLSAELGTKLTIDLQVDPAAAGSPPPGSVPSGSPGARSGAADDIGGGVPDDPGYAGGSPDHPDDPDIDSVHDLEDADGPVVDDIALLTEAFPGSELIESSEEPTP